MVVQEYITWKTWEHGLYSALGLACIMLGVAIPAISFWSYHKKHAWIYDDEYKAVDSAVVLPIISTIATLCIGCELFFSHIDKLLQVTLAPRVFLIEQVVSMLK